MKKNSGKMKLWGLAAVGLSAVVIFVWVFVIDRSVKRPNVVLIVLDTARADRFSFQGYERNTSPNIDALSAEGAVFERVYATSFWTLPSHASLFTGLYPSQTGATSETNQFPEFNVSLAEIFQEAGYDTAAVVCNSWISRERGFGQGFADFFEMWRKQSSKKMGEEHNTTVEIKPVGTQATKKAISWLEQHSTNDVPFFLFVNLNINHLPYRPPEPFFSEFLSEGYDLEKLQRVITVQGMWAHLAGEIELDEADLRIMSDLYDSETAFADNCVGQIVDRLKTLGILDETVVIVTSDHGENIGEHGMIDHLLSMYETTLHIPLVIRYPKAFSAGERVKALVSQVDIAPTLLDICRLENKGSPLKIKERSLCNPDRPRRIFVIAENDRPLNGIGLMKKRFPAFDTKQIDYRMRAIRTDRYKLIWKIGRTIELYDLQMDPQEQYNLSDTLTQVSDRLQAMLVRWMREMPATKDISFFKSKDTESLEKLRSLGYVE